MKRRLIDYIIIKISKEFDEHYYLTTYKDCRLADVDPLMHFVNYGWKEGRNPSADFDTSYYLNTYIDVRDTKRNPLVHYIRFGKKEGRYRKPNNSIRTVQNLRENKLLIINYSIFDFFSRLYRKLPLSPTSKFRLRNFIEKYSPFLIKTYQKHKKNAYFGQNNNTTVQIDIPGDYRYGFDDNQGTSIYSDLFNVLNSDVLSRRGSQPFGVNFSAGSLSKNMNYLISDPDISNQEPLISVNLIINNTPATHLRNLIISIINQNCSNWEINIWTINNYPWRVDILSSYFEIIKTRVHTRKFTGDNKLHLLQLCVENSKGKYLVFPNSFDELPKNAFEQISIIASNALNDIIYSQSNQNNTYSEDSIIHNKAVFDDWVIPFIQLVALSKSIFTKKWLEDQKSADKSFIEIFSSLLNQQGIAHTQININYMSKLVPGRVVLEIKACAEKLQIFKGRIPYNFTIDARLLSRKTTGTERYITEVLKSLASLRTIENFKIKAITFDKPSFDIDGVEFITENHLDTIQNSHLFHKTFPASDSFTLAELFVAPSVVFSPLDLISYNNPDYFNTEYDYFNYRKTLEAAAQLSDRVIAISHHGKSEIVSRLSIPENFVDVIYLGVRPDLFPKKMQEDSFLLSKINIPKKYFLYVGTDYPHKNLSTLLQAFQTISQEFPDIHLVLVGTSYYIRKQNDLEDRKKKLGERVISLGHVEDKFLPALYRNSLAFVFPSLYEGFGLPILEAHLCGTPVIASNATSIPEVSGNEAALLVNARNDFEIANAMRSILTNPQLVKKLIKAGFQNVLRFSWDLTGQKTLETYIKTVHESIFHNSSSKLENNFKKIDRLGKHNATILIVTHIRFFPQTAGNEQRLHNLVKYLHKLGYRILMVVNPFLETQPISREARSYIHKYVDYYEEVGDRSIRGASESKIVLNNEEEQDTSKWFNIESSFCPEICLTLVEDLVSKFNPTIIISEYIWMSRIFTLAKPGTLKVIDLHDLFSQKGNKLSKYGIKDQLSISESDELAFINRCDIALAIQNVEAKILCDLSPNCRVITAGIDYSLEINLYSNKQQDKTFVIVGSGNQLNNKCVNEFLLHSWQTILSKDPDCRLIVVGKVCDSIKKSYKNVELKYYIEDLSQIYEQASVVINPVYAGTGLKIKSVEALANGKALISWPEGVAGMPGQKELPVKIINSWQELAEAAIHLLQNPSHRKSLEQAALEFTKKEFSDTNTYRQLADAFDNYSKRSIRILCIYLRYGPNDYPEGLDVLREWYERKMSKLDPTFWIIDNKISPDYDGIDLFTGFRLFSGDNQLREFSGFDRILHEYREEIEKYDVVHFVTSAFDKLFTEYREYFSYELVYPVLHRHICLGHIDAYNEPISILNYKSQDWIRTCFFFISPEVLYSSAYFINISDQNMVFSDNGNFLETGIISSNYISYITDWLNGKEMQGVKWHNEITNKEDFVNKSISILNEHLFSIMLRENQVSLVDFYWLKENLDQIISDFNYVVPKGIDQIKFRQSRLFNINSQE